MEHVGVPVAIQLSLTFALRNFSCGIAYGLRPCIPVSEACIANR